MEKSTENTIGILNIIDLLCDKFDDDSMEYIEHYYIEGGKYKVILSDGSAIEIHRMTAADAEYSIDLITEETLLLIKQSRKIM